MAVLRVVAALMALLLARSTWAQCPIPASVIAGLKFDSKNITDTCGTVVHAVHAVQQSRADSH